MSNNVEFVGADEVPGVTIVDGKAYGKVGDRFYPVAGAVRCHGSYIPTLDIPQIEEQPAREIAKGDD